MQRRLSSRPTPTLAVDPLAGVPLDAWAAAWEGAEPDGDASRAAPGPAPAAERGPSWVEGNAASQAGDGARALAISRALAEDFESALSNVGGCTPADDEGLSRPVVAVEGADPDAGEMGGMLAGLERDLPRAELVRAHDAAAHDRVEALLARAIRRRPVGDTPVEERGDASSTRSPRDSRA